MHKYASFNHQILPTVDIKINAISSAGLFGKGIFTTIAIYNSRPFLWKKHWARLNDNAQKLGIDISTFSEQRVYESLQEVFQKNNVINGRCRITVFDESSSNIWKISDEQHASLLIQTAEIREAAKDLSAYVSPYPINAHSQLTGVKSCNYLENLLALKEANKHNYDEGLRYNEKNRVVSFCMANLFWLKKDDKKLYTPGLEAGCLQGTTRELILENFDVVEVEKDINEFLREVDTIFMTSSGIGVAQVTSFEGNKLNSSKHKLTSFIQNQQTKS